MAFWSENTWSAFKDADAPVDPFNRQHLDEAKYIMAIGEQVYISSATLGNTIRNLAENEPFTIGPGQFAYILTQETVKIPKDAIGFISINATTKFSGLVNISGFHVDPGYCGRIMFSVFNAGPLVIHLRRGERVFPLWIADLDKPSKGFPEGSGFQEIQPRFVTAISGAGNYTTAFELNGLVRDLRKEVDSLNNKVATLESTRIQRLLLIGFLLLVLSGVLRDLTVDAFHWAEKKYTWFGLRVPTPDQSVSPPSLQALPHPDR